MAGKLSEGIFNERVALMVKVDDVSLHAWDESSEGLPMVMVAVQGHFTEAAVHAHRVCEILLAHRGPWKILDVTFTPAKDENKDSESILTVWASTKDNYASF